MPIYEFYCPDCHTVFNFLSRRIDTETRPGCPRCHRPQLERRVSRFAISSGRQEHEEDLPAGMDETRLEQAMTELASEAEGMDEDNPREMARMMRRLFDSTGLPVNEGVREAISRLEAGEDPDKVEAEMGDLLESDDLFAEGGALHGGGTRALRRRFLPPSRDETLYEM